MMKWLPQFSILAAKFMCAPVLLRPSKTPLCPPQLESENIRESGLDFTALLGKIIPEYPIFAARVIGARKGCFCLFPLCSEGADEKNR